MTRCECKCDCCRDNPGPAAFNVLREGQRLSVCTRCILSIDEERKLLVKTSDSMAPFVLWDAMGAFVISSELNLLRMN